MDRLRKIIRAVGAKHGCPSDKSEQICRDFLRALKADVMGGNNISIHGFGTFKRVYEKAAKRASLVTGTRESITVPAGAKFKFSQSSGGYQVPTGIFPLTEPKTRVGAPIPFETQPYNVELYIQFKNGHWTAQTQELDDNTVDFWGGEYRMTYNGAIYTIIYTLDPELPVVATNGWIQGRPWALTDYAIANLNIDWIRTEIKD